MRINKSAEQAFFVLLLLSTQNSHGPLDSLTISTALKVSDSYLKKILRKLVVANLIRSVPGKNGGFSLVRSPEEITLAQIVQIFDPPIISESAPALARSLFVHQDQAEESILLFSHTMHTAHEQYLAALDTLTVASLIKPQAAREGLVDWQQKLNPHHPKENHES